MSVRTMIVLGIVMEVLLIVVSAFVFASGRPAEQQVAILVLLVGMVLIGIVVIMGAILAGILAEIKKRIPDPTESTQEE